MAKYLDQAGLQILWQTSKETFETKNEIIDILKDYVTDEELASQLTNYVKTSDFEGFKRIISEAGEALIFNEADGGGVKFTDKNGNASFVGVNQDVDSGIGAQIYDIDMATSKGTKLDVTKNGIFYTTGDESGKPAAERDVAANEIATKKDIQAIAHPEYSMRKDENPGDFAAVYHLTKDGEDVGEAINIAKDQLLKSVEVKTCTEKDVPVAGLNVGDKYIDFTFIVEGGQEAHSYIAVKDMVKPYTAGNGIIITSENIITIDTEVVATVEYVDSVADVAKNYIDQQVKTEHDERVASDEQIIADLAKLQMPTEPEFDETLNILFLNGNAVRITDNGTANVAEWFGTGSKAGQPNTLEFPYKASIACGGNGKEKVLKFSGAQCIMDGGDVKTIRGGGLGDCIIGDVEIIINGGKITAVTGGGQKYYSETKEQNTVNNVHIIINGGEFYGQNIVCAGGTDAVNVGHAVVDMNAGEVAWCYASGGNGGFVNDSVMNLNGGKINNLLGIVRGYLGNATMNVNGCQITNMYAGNDNDPSDDGTIKNVVLNILKGRVTTLLKGFSHVTEDFNCSGEYVAGIIGNEAEAIVACNLTLREVIGVVSLTEEEIREICK